MAKKRKSSSSSSKSKRSSNSKLRHKIKDISSSEEQQEEVIEEEEDDDDSPEASKRETLKEILQPFSKDQIIDFLKFAILQDKQILTRITQFAESDPTHRKLFVHGLGWDATADQLLSTFTQFGEIEDCNVPTDKSTGRVKGFAFILYKSRDAAQNALMEPHKKIGNRMTSCQLASAGPPVFDTTGLKIFVANVASHVNPKLLKLFFEQFGELHEGPLGLDSVTGKFKGFSMFVYKNVEGCNKALEEPVKVFDSCRLECRLATQGFKNNKILISNSNLTTGFGAASDFNSNVNYNVGGINQPFYANPAMMAQNSGFGLSNPIMVSSLNQTGLATSIGSNSQTIGFGGNYGINSVSPSVIATFAAQSSLQGLGAYQPQVGNSPAGSTAGVAARSQSSGFGSTGQAFSSYFRR